MPYSQEIITRSKNEPDAEVGEPNLCVLWYGWLENPKVLVYFRPTTRMGLRQPPDTRCATLPIDQRKVTELP